MLPAIGDDEGDLRRLRALAEPIEAGDGDDGFLAVDHDQRAVDVIDVREALENRPPTSAGARRRTGYVSSPGETLVEVVQRRCQLRHCRDHPQAETIEPVGISRPVVHGIDRATATGGSRLAVIGSLAAAPIEAMLCSPSSMNRPQEDTMLNAIPGLPSGVIGFEVTGKLDAEDYRDTPPAVAKAAEDGDIRLVIVLPSFEGIEPEAIWEDTKLGVTNWAR